MWLKILIESNGYVEQHLLAPHILDVMHCEKKLCENILKTTLGLNDTPRSQLDMQDMKIREEIWLQAP